MMFANSLLIVDEELIAKLESELSYEEQIDTSEELPSNIKEFMNAGIFTVRSTFRQHTQ